MIRHTRTFGAIGAALLSAIATAGCTNYIEANEPAPQILGVMVQDVNDNETLSPGFCSTNFQTCTADADCTGYCSTATLEACAADADCNGTTTALGFCSSTATWGCAVDADCPGFCVGATATGCAADEDCPPGDTCDTTTGQTCDTATGQTCVTAPAQTCTFNANSFAWPYPPRDGQMFAEGYVGNPVASPATWSLGAAAPFAGGIPSGPWPSPKYGPFLFGKPRIIFNKLLDGPSIQPDPAVCDPTANFTVTAAPGGDVTADFGVCYDPSSPTSAYGAAVVLVPAAGRLRSGTTYSIVGTVLDKQARNTDVDFTIVTAP